MKYIPFDLSQPKQEIQVGNEETLLATFVGREQQHLASHITFVCSEPNSSSNIHIKVVLYDQASCDITGNLQIPKGASGVNTYLRIDTLLMSERAKARAIPSLEIMEDDVRAGHAATVGEVDEAQLQYMQSRGLGKEAAEQMIVDGFLNDISEKLSHA